MNGLWILVLITAIGNSGIHVESIEFNSESACFNAAAKIVEYKPRDGVRYSYTCIKK